ncbi:nucleotide sugar dehydrogenase [Sphingobacterium shayense]|uniref:nucleotide sugar dehydrogenase n=1 Tax=Sphingobacterium shayense TaxID=626343 RepID=UPI00155741AA|nr:nucleotide sugar dehydrogenase [Sphingobacterium shayense]NQD70226.1 nucleotide sugar dehydrogenase [Sphingobacterium shayense]
MQNNTLSDKYKIAVIGQGYVGLPLAIEFAKHYPVVGYDIDSVRVLELKQGKDSTREVDETMLEAVLVQKNPHRINQSVLPLTDLRNENVSAEVVIDERGLYLTTVIEDIRDANCYIITVPTPIDRYNAPNLGPLLRATAEIGKLMKKGDLVIYESTVYPGCTEEDCVPILENISGLMYNRDFFVGYSPERINPGDKINTLRSVKKVTSGSTPEIAVEVDNLYQTIIVAGTHKAPSIRIAEAAKAVENAQRDINISFVNELALIFDRMGIDTQDVLDAASTKYNFLSFKPGLVGGHCISVDPFYLAHKATELGYLPNVILSGRRVNDQMGGFIASKVVKLLSTKNISINEARVLILGITFKENCADVRNTKVVDIYNELRDYGAAVDIYDPWASVEDVKKQYRISLLEEAPYEAVILENERKEIQKYSAIILAVAHDEFINLPLFNIRCENSVIFDVKGVWPRSEVDARL